ncbi:MAG TPA: AI-2E family transporter [Xanthomonadaceae bacterium]|nr:AI-2E family transporter [Xanthomonadaceae bacterium]
MSDTHKWQLLALTVLIGGLVYLLAPVLTPFAVAALLAYLGDPLCDRLARRMPRALAVTLVFVLMVLALVGALLLLVPMVVNQIERFAEALPRWMEWFRQTAAPWIEARVGFRLPELQGDGLVEALREHWQQAGNIAANLIGGVSRSGMAILTWIANLIVIPVVTFYLMRDWDVLVERIRQLLPRSVEPTVSRLARESDQMLGGFLRGQLSVMFALGVIYAVGLWLVGIDLALLIGMIAGLLSFVPYLGTFVGVLIAVIAALVQYGDVMHVALVLVVFVVGQILEGNVLTPWLVGDRIGMHPVAVIFAVLAGGQLFGFLGMLLALPVAAVIMVVLRYAHSRYRQSELYGAEAGAIVPEPMQPGSITVSSPPAPADEGGLGAAGGDEPGPQ